MRMSRPVELRALYTFAKPGRRRLCKQPIHHSEVCRTRSVNSCRRPLGPHAYAVAVKPKR